MDTMKSPIICEFCSQAFRGKSSKHRHIRSMHLHIKPWFCISCSRGFTRCEGVKSHLKDVHQLNDMVIQHVLQDAHKNGDTKYLDLPQPDKTVSTKRLQILPDTAQCLSTIKSMQKVTKPSDKETNTGTQNSKLPRLILRLKSNPVNKNSQIVDNSAIAENRADVERQLVHSDHLNTPVTHSSHGINELTTSHTLSTVVNISPFISTRVMECHTDTSNVPVTSMDCIPSYLNNYLDNYLVPEQPIVSPEDQTNTDLLTASLQTTGDTTDTARPEAQKDRLIPVIVCKKDPLNTYTSWSMFNENCFHCHLTILLEQTIHIAEYNDPLLKLLEVCHHIPPVGNSRDQMTQTLIAACKSTSTQTTTLRQSKITEFLASHKYLTL